MRQILILVLFVIGMVNSEAQTYTITSNMDGNAFRAAAGANPNIVVVDRGTFLKCDLIVAGGVQFSDNNASYEFYDGFGFKPDPNSEINLTDVNIIYSTKPKNEVSIGNYKATYNRVKFIQANRSGRSDFFANTNHEFDFNGVDISINGLGDSLYLRTTGTIQDMIVYSYVGSNLHLGPQLSSQTSKFSDIRLENINRIIGEPGALGTVEISDFKWEKPIWNITTNNVKFSFVNPVKPAGWVKYSDDAVNVSEYSTHKILLLDQYRNPINSAQVKLYNTLSNLMDFEVVTNTNGEIPEQKVLIYNSGISSGPWDLIITKYKYEYFFRKRVLDKKIEEDIILLEDRALTQTDASVVSLYPTIENSSKLYDRAKLWKIQNMNIDVPTLSELLIKGVGRQLTIPENWDLCLDNTAGEAFSVDKTNKCITIRTQVLEAGKYNRLKVGGLIKYTNDEYINFPHCDSEKDSYVRFVGLNPNDRLLIKEMNGDIIAEYKGECGYNYKSEIGKQVIVEYLAENNGDKAMYFYNLKNSGLNNYFRVAVGELNMETMFNTTDRKILRATIDKLVEAIESNDEQLMDILFWLKFLIHKVQPNPQKYSY
jgi:hypothetical protein